MRVIWSFAIGAGLVAGAAAGWFVDTAKTPLIAPKAAQMPAAAPQRYSPDAALAWLTRRDPWGARLLPVTAPVSTPPAQPLAVRPWRLGGVMVWGGDTMAIVLGEAGIAPEYRRVGEMLPDGSRIIDIQARAVTVEQGGVRRVLRLATPN